MANPPAPTPASLPRTSTSFWTGKVTADVSVGALGGFGTLQGDLNIEILPEGYPLPGAVSQASAELSPGGTSAGPPPPPPPTIPTVFGTLTVTFSAHWSNDGASAQGSGTVYYGVGGTYDPNAHTVSLTLATTGIQLTGAETRQDGSTQSLSLSGGGSLETLGTPNLPVPGSNPSLPQSGGNDGQLSACLPASTSNQQPITLNLQLSGSQVITQNAQGDDSYHASRTVRWIFTLAPHQVQVNIDPPQLDPTQDPSATLTVTVTSNGQPSKMETVSIEICTYIGGTNNDDSHAPDGHMHDGDDRDDMCDRSTRTTGELVDTQGLAGPPGQSYSGADFPIKATTGTDGKITMTYYPASDSSGKYFISGTEQIEASLLTAPNINDDADVTTQVANLEQAPGSDGGAGGATYYFTNQSNHGYEFWGTGNTNQKIVEIANAFYNAQIACKNGASAQEILGDNFVHNDYSFDATANGPRTFTTPGTPLKLRITAMSLPWGGLLDIKGGWDQPHQTHNDGTVADFGWADFTVAGSGGPVWNMDLIYLLGAIILNTEGASLPVPFEGGALSTTLAHFSGTVSAAENAHFHVKFAS
jgi:hypothetical protein